MLRRCVPGDTDQLSITQPVTIIIIMSIFLSLILVVVVALVLLPVTLLSVAVTIAVRISVSVAIGCSVITIIVNAQHVCAFSIMRISFIFALGSQGVVQFAAAVLLLI